MKNQLLMTRNKLIAFVALIIFGQFAYPATYRVNGSCSDELVSFTKEVFQKRQSPPQLSPQQVVMISEISGMPLGGSFPSIRFSQPDAEYLMVMRGFPTKGMTGLFKFCDVAGYLMVRFDAKGNLLTSDVFSGR